MNRKSTASPTLNDELRWAAICDRDASGDDRFVYAVRTTGVFCLPGCPSRRPNRENVRFFDDVASAVGAGFRPCRRCRPDAAFAAEDPTLLDAVATLAQHLESEPTVALAAAARALGESSAATLRRRFQRELGTSPTELLRALRFVKLRAELQRGATIGAAQWAAGFGSSRAIYEHAAPYLGGSPGRWSQAWRGEREWVVRYHIAPCRLGRALVGWTERGVASVLLGDDDAALEAMLREQLGGAEDAPGVSLERCEAPAVAAQAVVDHLDSVECAAGVELDAHGTEFQLTVWRALREIPPGETRSYGEVASMIGRPTAVRAVASACARNPIAVLIPCHRVVPRAGGTGEYRWGAARKERLLEREKVSRRAEANSE